MKHALDQRLLAFLRMMCAATALFVLSGQAAPPPEPEALFPHENISDLRGLVNVFKAFEIACLNQPVTRDLPERLVPEGYRIVRLGAYMFGEGVTDRSDTAILSRTGDEQSDRDGGFPAIRFSMPSQTMPDGDCSVAWKRAWDYPEPRDRLMLDMVARLEARVSYRLAAILVSRPDTFHVVPQQRHASVSHWVTRCWERKPCAFSVNFFIDREDGIDITVDRGEVMGQAVGQQP